MSGLIWIWRLSLELVQRRQERLERRLADEHVLVEVVPDMRLAPLDSRLAVRVGEHRLSAHAAVHEAVLFAVVASFFRRRRFELFAVQVLLYVAIGHLKMEWQPNISKLRIESV